MPKNLSYQFCIIGGGIIGLSLANALRDEGYQKILILEKESEIGKHASGRNSGVLHAGVYYPSDTLKAKFCLEGNQYWKSFCKKYNLPCLPTGKLLVCKNENDVEALHMIESRARENGANVAIRTAKQIAEIEPLAKTHKLGLKVENTAIVNSSLILEALTKQCEAVSGIEIQYDTTVTDASDPNHVVTNRGIIHCDFMINAAGAYADKIAHQSDCGLKYRLLPFKGIYKKLSDRLSQKISTNIYPVPDLNYPFLGIHLTKTVNGNVLVGPNAIPAFGPENYRGLQQLDRSFWKITWADIMMFLRNKDFRKLALTEPYNAIPKGFLKQTQQLCHDVTMSDIQPSSKIGIRPQLIDWQQKKLVMDFVIEKNQKSLHILNAISPAFTSAPAFAKYCVSRL